MRYYYFRLLITFSAFQPTAIFAAECRDIVNGQERLSCYDKREDLLASNKSYDIYQLWKAQMATRECDSVEVNPNGYAQYLIATDLKPGDAYYVQRDAFLRGRMDEDLANIKANHSAWCEKALGDLSDGEGHYGFALLRSKSSRESR